MTTRMLLALLSTVLLGLSPAHAADAPASPCRLAGLRHEVLCGQVARPLDPARPDGRTIAVHYALVPAAARNKKADPVFFFAGGPGQSAIALAGKLLPLFQRLNNRRDIVFIDQRGTGRSAPLECEPDEGLPLAEQMDGARAIERLRDCGRRLQSLPQGALGAYTTPIAMADADAVRAALGAPRVNLVGGSYGTRAALDYLRQFPQRVRRVVIDGVAPPDMALPLSMGVDVEAALGALFADCERDRDCRARHPALRAHWLTLMRDAPPTVSVIDPATGRLTELRTSREVFALAVRGPLYAPALAAGLPFAIDEAAAGRFTALVGLAGSLGGGSRAGRLAEGMHFSVVCSEDYPLLKSSAAPVGALAAAYARPYEALCADWPRGELPPAFYTLPPSPAAVLALSGALDPVTPPRHGERVVRALGPKARHVVVPNAGHGVLSIGCARDVLHRFIDAEDDVQALAVDTDCLSKLPRPPAFAPPEPVRAGASR